MKLLFLTSRLPYPPNRGDRLRAFYFLRELSETHEITLVSFIAKEAERDYIPLLQPYCEAVHVVKQSLWQSITAVLSNLWQPHPLQLSYYQSPIMAQLIDQLVANNSFDAAYVHLFRMSPYVAAHGELYRIVDLTDVISQEITLSLPYRSLLWRTIYKMERPRIWQYEQEVAHQFEESWLIADADRQILANACPKANIQLVPNGVDTKKIRPLSRLRQPNSLIFVGHLGVFHNVDAVKFLVEDILPIVQQHIPTCTLNIVGAGPLDEVEQFGDHYGVTITGFVEDLNLVLNETAVFVAPLRFSAGVQNKVLEAMAAGLPAVVTSNVNGGLGAEADRHLLVGDTPAQLAVHIIRLLQNQTLRDEIGRAARQFVVQQFSWHHVTKRLEQIEQQLPTVRHDTVS
ncbi:MAG: glycosyltransferase [Chloroflexota bacterium]